MHVDMKSVSATDAKQGFAALLDAAQQEPIVIRRRKRDVAVLISVKEFEKMRDPNVAELQAYCDRLGARAVARGLTTAKLRRILNDAS